MLPSWNVHEPPQKTPREAAGKPGYQARQNAWLRFPRIMPSIILPAYRSPVSPILHAVELRHRCSPALHATAGATQPTGALIDCIYHRR